MHLFLLHSLVLLTASFATARRLWSGAPERILATALLGWANIVATSLLLSAAHGLGDRAWFFRTSLLLALGTWLALRRWGPAAPAAPDPAGGRLSRPLAAVLGLTLLPLAWASLRLAATYEPNNYDSLTYHLPRVMFYLGQNSLAHFDTGNDRQIFFPFHYNLLQLFALGSGAPLQSVNFLNLAAWALAGVAVARLSVLAGWSRNAALVSAWLTLTATQILAQATATTNDLPTGATLAAVLVFVARWRTSRLRRDAWLAGLAAGLAAGSKLTVVFFGPAAALIVLGLAWRHWRAGRFADFLAGTRAWVLPGLLAAAVASPFALINLAERGVWMTKQYDYTLNRPFRPGAAVQTGAAYLVEIAADPLHRFTFDEESSRRFSRWAEQAFFPHWNPDYAFSPLLLFPSDLNEDHVYFGFAGPLFLLCAAWCLLRPRPAPAVWLALLGLGWLATYFAMNRWSLYNQRYFILPLILLAPSAGLLVDGLEHRPLRRLLARATLLAVGLSALWLAGVYLFKNSSRPYEPLWRGLRPPPALPKLPDRMVERLSAQSRINFDSTDGNERAFLFMTLGRNQRFTAYARTTPKAYNVFSLWGFVRKVVYANIEQESSYTIVKFPTKRTAGVEFLGKIGSGQPALDYYGLAPFPETVAASDADRHVLVKFLYGPREPGRFAAMRVRVAGLNDPDRARAVVSVEYADQSVATLATFPASGEAAAPVTRPFRRFLVRIEDRDTGETLGSAEVPYLTRTLGPEYEAPDDPAVVLEEEFISLTPGTQVAVSGLGAPEGPYPQWRLPLIRWARAPVLRLEVPATADLARLELAFGARLQARDNGHIDVVLNGELVDTVELNGSNNWFRRQVRLQPREGANVIELRNVALGEGIDWDDYLARYPDVKNYLVSAGLPLQAGARDHYEAFGRKENRVVHRVRRTDTLADPQQLYYVFDQLHLTGYRTP